MDEREVDFRAEAAAEIRRGAMRLARRLRVERPVGALSSNKLSVLSHLFHAGPSTPGQLAAAERQQPQSLTRVFAELELAGLVTRTRGERDRREHLLSITPQGQQALFADVTRRDNWLAAALDDLGEVEIGVLRLAASLMERIARSQPSATRDTDAA